jgi:hypothetical protein
MVLVQVSQLKQQTQVLQASHGGIKNPKHPSEPYCPTNPEGLSEPAVETQPTQASQGGQQTQEGQASQF